MKRVCVGMAALLGGVACRDLSGFSTKGDSFEGAVVQGDFVRAGVAVDARLCLTLDADHFQDQPGRITTSDGRFRATSLRSIPQVWRDPLSTLTFGEGRVKNMVYVAAADTPFDDGNGNDVLTVVSLMQSGGVEVRLLRGAPPVADGVGTNTGDASASEGGAAATNLFAIFALQRQKGPCSY